MIGSIWFQLSMFSRFNVLPPVPPGSVRGGPVEAESDSDTLFRKACGKPDQKRVATGGTSRPARARERFAQGDVRPSGGPAALARPRGNVSSGPTRGT